MRAGFAAVLLIGSCADEPPEVYCAGNTMPQYTHVRTLAQFPDLAPQAGLSVDRATVQVFWGERGPHEAIFALHEDGHGYCLVVDKTFSITLDGARFEESSEGGWVCVLATGALCNPPSATFTIPPGFDTAHAMFTISDKSRTVTVPLIR